MDPSDRFWAHVARGDGCWEWAGTRNSAGYGVFWDGTRQVRAHRFAWALEGGPIPEGANVCHRCDNPPCIRPDHLFLGTQRENLEDMTRKGRRRRGQPDQAGTRNPAAKLTDEQVAHIKGMAAAGHYHDEIAARFGVTRANVSYIAGRTWSHVAPVQYPPVTRGRRVGRKPALDAKAADRARRSYTGARGELTALARAYGVSLTTMWRVVRGIDPRGSRG